MQFSKLRLTGFKSFVDPTELIISDGLTGVVGPNGCGKSNLLEALRWVMGENRPTAMRGGGMDDVIFAGAATRPARNYAEVTLQIDNTSRTAPASFNDADNLEIIRRITRDVGSAYKANGKEARARDVQMLFADASTGAHSPALVRQGQIAELINAKPKARRRILEEAAGISGLYQRRHEAELKLKNTETNLARVDDVIEQLNSQLATLARQARQAVRYREISAELRRSEGLLLYGRWKEADQKRLEAEQTLTKASNYAASEQTKAAEAAKLRTKLEEKIPPLREEEAIAKAILQRLSVERDTLNAEKENAERAIETLTARITQLTNDIAREADLNKDAAETIMRLQTEADQLQTAAAGYKDRLDIAHQSARDAATYIQDKEAELDKHSEDVARLAARHQSAHRKFEDTKTRLDKCQEQSQMAIQSMHSAEEALKEAEARLNETKTHYTISKEAVEQAEQTLKDMDQNRLDAQAYESETRAAFSEADGEANALGAEIAALKRVIARDQTSEVQLIDTVQADSGFEAALGAALSDDLKAPVIEPSQNSGWVHFADYDTPITWPDGVTPLMDHVKAPDVLARRLHLIGLVARQEGPKMQEHLLPGQRLVSIEGDLWRWDGYRTHADETPTEAALRLQQENRLRELETVYDKAKDKAEMAKAAFEDAHEALKTAADADADARRQRKAADDTATEATRQMSRAEADRDMLSGKLETLQMAQVRLDEETQTAHDALKEAEIGLRDLGDLDAARQDLETLKASVETARTAMLAKRAVYDEIRHEGEVREKRQTEIVEEINSWQQRLETADKRIAELEARKTTSEKDLKRAHLTPGEMSAKREELGKSITTAQNRATDATDVLSAAETELRQAENAEREMERTASSAREARARADALTDAARAGVETAAERIHETLDMAPEDLLKKLDANLDTLPEASTAEADVMRLRRQRDALGAVNLRAEEDAKEISEERDALVAEKDDLDAAVKKLRTGIAGLNREGRTRLLNAFDEVNKNFSTLFKHLFGGGEANLVLVESDDPLEAGLEIMCQPPGKKLSTLSLLSGGEQTLTALSLIFAVFLANPSPICVLDEVDAPLDDANVNRFCDLLDEMAERTQTRFLIITHHVITMARMNRLFGVTMAERGVSQLVSVDLQEAERMTVAA